MSVAAEHLVQNLAEVLRTVPRERFSVTRAELTRVLDDYDYELKEAMNGRLSALPRGTGVKVEAVIPLASGPGCYVIDAGARKAQIAFRDSFGGNIAVGAHYTFELRENSKVIGSADHFPNVGLGITDRDPCLALSIFHVDNTTLYYYKGNLSESWWRVTPYSVTLDERFDPVALIIDSQGFWSRKALLKLRKKLPDLHIGLLLAAHGSLRRG